jgi:hypothetical protein
MPCRGALRTKPNSYPAPLFVSAGAGHLLLPVAEISTMLPLPPVEDRLADILVCRRTTVAPPCL